MPAQAGIQPVYVNLATLGLGPSLRWGDGEVYCLSRRCVEAGKMTVFDSHAIF